jgi:DNA-3-methyladenine glycosylase II
VGAGWFADAVVSLADRDPHMRTLYLRNGIPPHWRRQPGFASMTQIVLEQQVSLASAAAAFGRLGNRLGGEIEPGPFLELTDVELRQIGFSRQKAGYLRELAAGIATGEIDLAAVEAMGDDDARLALLELRGIGPWTAGIYLMFTLDRPDVWPPGDRALQVAMASALELDGPPSSDEAADLARRWKPWRSAAARLLWHDYLGGPDVVPA